MFEFILKKAIHKQQRFFSSESCYGFVAGSDTYLIRCNMDKEGIYKQWFIHAKQTIPPAEAEIMHKEQLLHTVQPNTELYT